MNGAGGTFVINAVDVPPSERDVDEGWRMTIRFLFPESVARAGGVCLFRATFQPGAVHERHLHARAAEFFYVISGRAGIGAETSELVAEAGTVQLIPAGTVHWLRNLGREEPVEVIGGYLGVSSLDETGYEFKGPITAEHRLVT